MRKIVLLTVFLPLFSFAQTKQDSVWIPLRSLIGVWTGDSEGQPGKGKYERSYQFALNKKFIEVRNKSTYPPTKNNPNGEVHEDRGFISYDRGRKTFVLRQFHMEGFVNQFKIESISRDGRPSYLLQKALKICQTAFGQKRLIRSLTKMNFWRLLN